MNELQKRAKIYVPLKKSMVDHPEQGTERSRRIYARKSAKIF